jgi:hypothetical protein
MIKVSDAIGEASNALRQLRANGLGFQKVQHWSSYAGNRPSEGNDYAYPVGSSFVYFVIDSFGEKKLFDFFRDVGETRDLDTSLQHVFGLGAAVVEQRWKDYVVEDAVPEAPLTITEMFPANNSIDIPIDIAELDVRFSVSPADDAVGVHHEEGRFDPTAKRPVARTSDRRSGGFRARAGRSHRRSRG